MPITLIDIATRVPQMELVVNGDDLDIVCSRHQVVITTDEPRCRFCEDSVD